VPLAKSRSIPSSLSGLQGFEFAGLSGQDTYLERPLSAHPLDKSKFSLFKPSSLDVIFHECKIIDISQGNFDAFTG
jgi:hypothetical protein